ncbi:hypothetical protein C2845_PM14G06140 [Panicum miliaceum]|uniref:Uncharacterized protein n=1 Tax=Panicum miliaceum TaxID=4540 RepID=A0A3L6PP49_PANMI|nr:hypothetical protein C2845_PM14G06140 [Panicum miliaceum]
MRTSFGPYVIMDSQALYRCLMDTVMEAAVSSDAQMARWNYLDEGNCRFAKFVDPPIHDHTQEYIHYLKCKIFDLENRVESLEEDENANPSVVSIEDDPLCSDPWCKCPYRMKKNRAPSPPSSGGAGYYEAGSSQYSQNKYY